ncbi:MAG: hypothetical protein K6E84_04065 [Lachnospiraceae bacterium]|nr:hypothetical protein [Lachnospiraceae bacterium]
MKVKTKQLLAFLMSLTLLASSLTLPATADTTDKSDKAVKKTEAKAEKAEAADEEGLSAEGMDETLFAQVKTIAKELTSGNVTVSINDTTAYIDNRYGVWYKFTPAKDGTYRIWSLGNTDTYLYLFNENGEQIDRYDDANDDSNFCAEREYEAGHTYYFYSTVYSRETTAEYSMFLSKVNIGEAEEEQIICAVPGEVCTISANVVVMDSEATLTYQWEEYKGEYGYVAIEGADQKDYSFTVAEKNEYRLRCQIKSEEISVYSYHKVKVSNISLNGMAENNCRYHSPYTLAVSGKTIRPELPINIIWKKLIDAEDDLYETVSQNTISANTVSANDVLGWFTDSLFIPQAESGSYQCVVTQEDNDTIVTDASFLMSVIATSLDLEISGSSDPGINNTVQYTLTAEDPDGNEVECTYRWKVTCTSKSDKVTTIIDDVRERSGEGANSITFKTSLPGEYHIECVARSAEGETKSCTKYACVDSNIDAEPVGNTVVFQKTGSKVTLSVKATTDYGKLYYQWYEEEPITGATGSSYSFTLRDGWEKYYCDVNNGDISQSVDFYVINTDKLIKNTSKKENAKAVIADQVYAVYGQENCVREYLKFTPEVDDEYLIYSRGEHDTVVSLYDEKGNLLADNDDYGETDDYKRIHGNSYDILGNNFLIAYSLKAGKTYYLEVCMNAGDDEGYFGFLIEGNNKKNLSTGELKLSQTSIASDGSSKTPGVTVTYKGKTLKNGTDYTVAYQNNVNPGTASVVVAGKGKYYGSLKQNFTITAGTAPMGAKTTSGGATYKVTGKNEVAFTGLKNKKQTRLTIPDTVKIGGVTCKVTSVDAKALNSATKVKTLTLGKNINKIGRKAFAKMKKLKTLKIKSTNMTAKSLSKGAFKGFKGTIKVKKSKLKAYKTLFRKKGLAKTVKVKKL